MPHTNSKERNRRRAALKASSRKPGSRNSTTSFATKKSARSVAVYDDEARHEYLTGFSTRKKAAKAAAQQRALRRQREEKLEIRRQLKATRLAKVKDNVEQQAEWYGDDAFATLELDQLIPKRTEMYEDNEDEIGPVLESQDDQDRAVTSRTTVTVEAFSIDHSVLTDKPLLSRAGAASSTSKPNSRQAFTSAKLSNRHDDQKPFKASSASQSASSSSKAKKKKIGKIPYESKATRTIDRAKKQRKRDEKSDGKTKFKKRAGLVKRG